MCLGLFCFSEKVCRLLVTRSTFNVVHFQKYDVAEAKNAFIITRFYRWCSAFYISPLYLSRNCYTGRDENKNIDTSKRDCNWFQYAKPKLTDNPTTTKSDEEVEQKFSLDYQGNFLLNEMLISTYDVQCRSSSTLEAVATKAGPASKKQLGLIQT